MRIETEVDDILLAQAKRVTGLHATEEVVIEALRGLILRAQSEAIETLKGTADSKRNAKTLRKSRELLEDLDDIEVALERLKNPGRRLTMEEAEKELGLDERNER